MTLGEVDFGLRHTKVVQFLNGMLEPWSLKQKWLKKRIARWLYQDRDLKKAAALHATAESEAEQFQKLGFKNYCIVSPNGVNLPEGKVERVGGISPDKRESRSERYAGCGQQRLFLLAGCIRRRACWSW